MVAELSPAAREDAIARMTEHELDVLVVGGGVVGAGSALDAVTRGLTTAIVEARDWASGTSSRSSKLIHGGLRYLEMLDFGLVREALTERGLLLDRIAPHLVRPVPFLYPLQHRLWERPYVGAGVALYDVINERYERGSIVLTSNRAPSEWAELFGDPLLASAGLDRLGHRAIVVTITGSSYRLTPQAKGEEGEEQVTG